jgi:hypothetical protein
MCTERKRVIYKIIHSGVWCGGGLCDFCVKGLLGASACAQAIAARVGFAQHAIYSAGKRVNMDMGYRGGLRDARETS